MWELIRENRRKSFLLFVLMGTCLVLLGYFIGAAYLGEGGGFIGIILAVVVWMFLAMLGYFAGDSIMLSVSGAHQITREIHPQLFNVVEEMKIAAALPAMPKIYVIDDACPNAFATGRDPQRSSVAVTAGLLTRLNRDELQGVVAHEMSHVLNRDILFMTFAGVMLGSIVIISEVFFRGMWLSSGSSRRYRSDRSGGGQAQAIIMIVAMVFAIMAPILARLLYLAISRRREYLADASAVRLTRYPEGLASALEKISTSPQTLARADKVTAPMYIVNPLEKMGAKASDWMSTHPPIKERIAILRAISQGASYGYYQEAFDKIKGKASQLIPPAELRDTTVVPLRTGPSAAEPMVSPKKRELGDLIRAVNGFMFLQCACGLKLKIPPNFNKPSLNCPRCGRELTIPSAELATVATAATAVSQSSATMQPTSSYVRQGKGWETFTCSCGNPIQLSSNFQGSEITCSNCGRKTQIR